MGISESEQPQGSVRVTVIIPAYKAAATLPKAVQSVLRQTEPSIEILIVDDCSPDDTWEVATKLAARDPRVRAIQMPQNGGKSIAMNHATTQARGEWIAILDADDWYEHSRLKRLLDDAEKEGVDMVADNQIFIDFKAGAHVGTAFVHEGKDKHLDLDTFLEGSDPTARFDYGMLKPVFRKSFIHENRIEYYPPARNGQDYYILLCFFVAGGKALIVDEPLYCYVQPFGAISGEWAREGRRRYNFELIEQINEHFIEEFKDTLSPEQLQKLVSRSNSIRAMSHFHQIRESLRAGNIHRAFRKTFSAPPGLWTLIGQRLRKRIRSFC